jgi:hypothetical protein
MKAYDIELQRLKSVRHGNDVIELAVDALVQPRSVRDDVPASSSLRFSVADASTLLLLKQQIAELDKLQPRSRRSGRS